MRLFSSIFTLGLIAATSVKAATTCNGHSELCSRLYSNVTFIGAHDSYAVGTNVADNQDKSVTAQLNDGIRTLQIQTHNATDGIHVCHTSCSLVDGGTLASYLTSVATWVKANPNDVVTIVMVNIDDLPPTSFSSAISSSGLESHLYSPSSATISINSWPTLGALIDAGTTVVIFMDEKADFSSVPYLIDEFSNMFEDAFDVTDATFGCAVNRSTGTPSSSLMLVNHFLDTSYTLAGSQLFVPNKAQLNTTNAASGSGSIGQHVTNCFQLWGRNPNHILLDYYDSNGNAPFTLAASLNGVSAPTNTVTVGTPSATATGSGSTASVSTKSLNGAGSLKAPGSLSSLAFPLVGAALGGLGMWL